MQFHPTCVRILSTELIDNQTILMLNGEIKIVNINNGAMSKADISIGEDAKETRVNIQSRNCVIYIIDKTLIPML
ncbi:MAG: hypothetical protein KAI29_25160 [Cyclobacteriaceae bacterium]|nr:hypothetical protein [Cyclobacteriaceae bacterium]